MNDPMDWIDKREEQLKDERANGYFSIVEGAQQFVLLTHCAPLAQVYDPATKKYRAAEEGDKNVSIKGVCWVLQDGVIKEAKLPYTILKSIREIQNNPDWEFVFPFPHTLTLTAIGAGTKEVQYSLTPSPKVTAIPDAIIEELVKKPTPEEIVEKIRGARPSAAAEEDTREAPGYDYPPNDINPADIPFD